MPGFPDHIVESAFGPNALAATHRRAEQQPRWLAGLIAKHGQPTTRQTDARREWHWGEERGVEICWSGGFGSVDAWQPARMASVALRSEPTDADISAVVALAGLCDAPERAVADPIVPTPLPGPVDDHVDRVSGPIRTAEQPATVRRVRSS